MSLPDKVSGRVTACPDCGDPIICEMSTYPAESKFDNYLQWKNTKDKKPHSKSCVKKKPGPRAFPGGNEGPIIPVEPPLTVNTTEIKWQKIPGINVELHDAVWAFAMVEATKVYPLKMKGGTDDIPLVDINFTPRMILAQVFYKKNMDYAIHKGIK